MANIKLVPMENIDKLDAETKKMLKKELIVALARLCKDEDEYEQVLFPLAYNIEMVGTDKRPFLHFRADFGTKQNIGLEIPWPLLNSMLTELQNIKLAHDSKLPKK
jgi:hypothetical protein